VFLLDPGHEAGVAGQVGEQQATAEKSRDAYQVQMTKAGYGEIKTSILPLDTYYYAEDYHQQYLYKNPAGYCPIHATGVQYADA